MKTMKLLMGAAAMALSLNVVGQAETASDEVREQCKANSSMFYQFAKVGNYADAYQPWFQLYNNCPDYTKNIYIFGPDIVKAKIKAETDEAKKQELTDLLLKVYDSRIQYYGNDKNYPTAVIRYIKANDYVYLTTPKDAYKKEAYGWYNQSISELGNKMDAGALQNYMYVATNLYKGKMITVEEFIGDYNKTADILNAQIADTTNANAATVAQVKNYIDQLAASTGALNGKTLDNIYASQIDGKKADLDYLTNLLNLYKSVGAVQTPVYYKASEYAYKIRPTEESAVGLAGKYQNEKDYVKAIYYLEGAIGLSTSNDKKADYELQIAYLERTRGMKSEARAHARKSLEYAPSQGEPHLLIGDLYASSTGIYSDPVLAKTVYWVAVDEYQKAKQDPSCASKAQGRINKYSSLFPADNDIFMHPDLNKGQSYTVGGWIGVSTTCR